MNRHRYILQPYKGMNTRYRCPECNKGKTFTRYIDTETGEHLADHVGRCERVDNCGNHYTPKQYFQDNRQLIPAPTHSYTLQKASKHAHFAHHKKEPEKEKAVSLIPIDTFKGSLKTHEANNFIKYLHTLFGADITRQLISKYFIGTSKHWPGANVFWQIDITGKVRTGKIMLYNPATGKRIKQPYNYISWVQSVLNLPEYELRQCFFGEHLLQGNTKPIAIVESEKTAIIASVYLPQFIWLAAGSKDGLSLNKCQVLKGRTVIIYPDLNGFEKWTAKAKELSHIASFAVSDLLERKATDKEKGEGLDLADYLIRFPVPVVQPQTLHLYSTDINSMLGNTCTGNDFSKIIIQGYQFKSGKVYDLLFSETGELLKPGEQPETVKKLGSFFEKKLQPAMFDNNPCWVHLDNRFIINNN